MSGYYRPPSRVRLLDDFECDRVFEATRSSRAWSYRGTGSTDSVRMSLGLTPRGPLPFHAIPETKIGNITYFMVSADEGYKQHRLKAICPDCGKITSVSQFYNHAYTFHMDERARRARERYETADRDLTKIYNPDSLDPNSDHALRKDIDAFCVESRKSSSVPNPYTACYFLQDRGWKVPDDHKQLVRLLEDMNINYAGPMFRRKSNDS